MATPQAFCRQVMHEYERQWSRAGGHAVRHPLRVKIERLQDWCGQSPDPETFERQLEAARASDDVGEALLAEELLPLWRTLREGGHLPFASTPE